MKPHQATTEEKKVFQQCRTLLVDLYNYFRMDSLHDPILLFEQVCYVLAGSWSYKMEVVLDKEPSESVWVYERLVSEFALTELGRELDSVSAEFSGQPELVYRLLRVSREITSAHREGRLQLGPLLSDFFETITQTRRTDIFGTPMAVAQEIVKMALQPQLPPYTQVLDPACGSGAFLISLAQQLDEEGATHWVDVLGLESDGRLRGCAVLLLHFYGIRAKVRRTEVYPHIEENCYDLILANPPFRSVSLRDRKMIGDYEPLPVQTRDVHRAFVQRILLGLKWGGRAAVIVPNSFLMNTNSDAIRVRRWMMECYCCEGVVQLPAYTFYPQASVNASVMFLHKAEHPRKGRAENESVFFFAVDADGRSNDRKRLPIEQNDFKELQQIWSLRDEYRREWQEQDRDKNVYGFDVPIKWNYRRFWFGSWEDIRNNDFCLLPEQYQPDQVPSKMTREPEEILREMRMLGQEIFELLDQLAEAEHEW